MKKVLDYPVAPFSAHHSCADGTRCETTKSKLFGATLNDMEIVQGSLPDSRTILRYYLDVEDSVRTFFQYCEAIRGLSKVRSSEAVPRRCSLQVFS